MCTCWVGNHIKKLYTLWNLEEDGRGGRNWVAVAVAAEMVEEWKGMIVAFCLSSAIAIATVSVQIDTKKLPNSFQFLSIVSLLCFGFMGIGKMTKSNSKKVSEILNCVGGGLAVTGFFIATAIPYAPYFQMIVFLIYLIFWLIFLLVILNMAPSNTSPIIPL